MQRSTSSGTSDSVSCCSDKVSPELLAAFWMAWTQPRKSSFRSPWMYSVLPARLGSAGSSPNTPVHICNPQEGWPWGPAGEHNSVLGVYSHGREGKDTPEQGGIFGWGRGPFPPPSYLRLSTSTRTSWSPWMAGKEGREPITYGNMGCHSSPRPTCCGRLCQQVRLQSKWDKQR